MGLRIETIALGIGLAIMVGLVVAFVSLTDGINQDPSTIVREAPRPATAPDITAGANPTTEASPEVEASPPADVIAPTVTADAPIVLGSVSMLTNTARDYVQLDVDACTPGAGSVDVRNGKLNLEMRGRDGSDCQLDYGTNIANANPDGIWTATCRIPAKLGKVKLATRDDGADFSPIASYCSDA